jgi:class 3 adenylate cyclase
MTTHGAGVKHRLLAILAADVAGYSRLVAVDDVGALQALDAAREVFRHHVATHDGRVIDTAADSVLAVFDTATGAGSASLAIQQALTAQAAEVPAPQRMLFRIGIHLGDVLEKDDGAVYSDGVNIAARLQARPNWVASRYRRRCARRYSTASAQPSTTSASRR